MIQQNNVQRNTELAEIKIDNEAKFYTKLRNELIIKLIKKTNSKEVIDMGCGTGKTTVELFNHFDISGCDISEELLEIARKKSDKINFIKDDMRTIKSEKKYDCALFLGVTEHIEDDVEVLKNTKNILKGGGYIIIEVPAFMFLWSKRDESLGHYRRYTKKILKQKLEDSGYEIVFMKYWKFSMLFGTLLTKILKREEYPYGVLNPLTRKAIGFWFKYLENNFIFPIGETIYVIARKKEWE